jgi:hypothetical protein
VFALVVLDLVRRRIRLFRAAGVDDRNRLVSLTAQLVLAISRCSVLRDVPVGGLSATSASFVIGMAVA